MKKVFIIILSLVSLIIYAQDVNNIRNKTFLYSGGVQSLDTLSIIPESLILLDINKKPISDSLYTVDYEKGQIQILDTNSLNKEFQVSYRVFHFSFSEPYYHKDISMIRPKTEGNNLNAWFYQENSTFSQNIYKDELNKNGSISRGISFGNSQDMSVNSNLNFQVSGKLNDNLNIIASISDNNIPIQPDGYSQQIQEFDKIFLKLYNQNISLTAGDFELEKPTGYFLNFYKKLQGGMFVSETNNQENKDKLIRTRTAVAIAKGKYARNSFPGQEGNQGPYRLEGSENETYIIVLSGTERVYIDGVLLTRGQENDYEINYNTAEISFTPQQPITKEKRIIVEFEYSERNYARFLVQHSTEIKIENSNVWVNIYSEQDAKNQSLQQELTNSEKHKLSLIGDDLNSAIVPRIYEDSVFDGSKVLYKMIDTLVSGATYDSVFVYSNNPTEAKYRLSFSLVGANNGNYIPAQTSANGKVFEWTTPVNGVPQGSYEPVALLISPKLKQVITLGGNTNINENLQTGIELALSNNDINTFSKIDANDNIGYALKFNIKQNIPIRDTSNIITSFRYELVDKNFDPVKSFRPVEFERDWNLANSENKTEHLLRFNTELKTPLNNSNYAFNLVNRGIDYSGFKNDINTSFKYKSFNLLFNGSLLNSTDLLNTGIFLRHNGYISKRTKYTTIGFRESSEDNQKYLLGTDSLLLNSYSFNEIEFYLVNPDSFVNSYKISYKRRKEYLPLLNQLNYATYSEDINLGWTINKDPRQSFEAMLTYRSLQINDTLLTSQKPENTAIVRLEHSLRLFKRTVSSSTFYEIGSGLESVKEYSYIEVAPGQGVYQWTDYNENNIKELDEFEIASFQDKANFIRIFTPTNKYEKVFTNQFNQIVNIQPYMVWKKSEGIKKVLSRFSDQFAYRTDRKQTSNDILANINPFTNHINNTELRSINSSLKNTFSFNKFYSKFGVDYVIQSNKNRLLLVYGLDTRSTYVNGLHSKWKLAPSVTLLNYFDVGTKTYESEFFDIRNYKIEYFSGITKIDYEIGLRSRISFTYEYHDKENNLDIQRALEHNIGTELNYNFLKKGIITLQSNYINISYNDQSNTPIAYEMLEGLLPGNNLTWELMFRRNLTNTLELNLMYSGRKSEGTNVIQTGSVQMRAGF